VYYIFHNSIAFKHNQGTASLRADISMKILFIFVWVFLSGAAIHAHTEKTPTIIDNATTALTRFGWQDKVRIIPASAHKHKLLAQFVSAEAEAFVLNELKNSKKFKKSNGIMLRLFHPGAKKSFRELNRPSMHIIWYENRIEIHFDLHCPGLKRPFASYKHFREVFINFWHRSTTPQTKVARALQDNR
jgi:hypothetical protein